MDVRLNEFPRIQIERYIPELDLLESLFLNAEEKAFLLELYDFIEDNIEPYLTELEQLNYLIEEPIQERKKEAVKNIMKTLSKKRYYSTVLSDDQHEVGRITRNALIALALCGGFWSKRSERYINGNWSIEMGRLAGGTLYCNPVNYAANEEQKEKYLKPVVSEGIMAASAMTEFNAGSDIVRIELKLNEEADKVFANGKKLFITNGMLANVIILYGRRNNGRLGAVILNTENQNLKNFESSRVMTYGMRDAFVSRLVFNDVEISKENMLKGDGLDIMFHQLTEERTVISAEAIGDAILKLYYSHAYASQREQFQRKLHQFQIMRFPITKNLREINPVLTALLNYTRQLDNDPHLGSSKVMASQAMGLKIQTCELAFQSSVDLFRTMGGRGFTEQYCNQVGLLDAYCMIHGGGSQYVLGDAESRRLFKSK